MLNLIILFSLFVVTVSTKIGHSNPDDDDEKPTVLTQSQVDQNVRRGNRMLADTEMQLPMSISNLMDGKELDGLRRYDEYISIRDQYQNIITEQRNILGESTQNLQAVQVYLATHENELENVKLSLNGLAGDINYMTQQLGNLKEMRENERKDFQAKMKEAGSLIAGIESTQDSFHGQAVGDEDLNQVAVQHILGLMKGTRESLEASLKHDIKAEKESERNYKEFVEEGYQLVEEYKVQLEVLKQNESILKVEISDLKNRIYQENLRRNEAELILGQAIIELEDLNRKYYNPNSL